MKSSKSYFIKCQNLLEHRFPTVEDFAPRGHLTMSGDIFGCTSGKLGRMLLASSM